MTRRQLLIFVIFASALGGLLAGCVQWAATKAANKIYPDLQAPYDNEAPPTTMTYPASTSIKAVIGGKGEGLSCSVPWLLEKMMFSKGIDEAPLSLQLRQACVRHDYCYRHGWATYGYQQVGCDFALQQDAYRICRIAYISNTHDDCLSKARRVLLGVRVGGGSPFQEGEKSSYFEYEPMPSTADDYVVTRWVGDPVSTVESCSIEPCLRGKFVTLHFKRGTVKAKKMMWKGIKNNSTFQPSETLFPDRFIATPPNVVFDAGKDRLMSIARDGFSNTKFKLIEFNLKDEDDDEKDELIFSSKAPKDKKENLDPDASIFWLTKQNNNNLAVSYWSQTITRYGMYELNDDKLVKSAAERSQPVVHDPYRTLAHKPIEGDFFEKGKREIIVLKRGGIASEIGKSNSGEEYQEKLHLIVLKPEPNNGYRISSDDVITIKATEEDEPLVPIKNQDGRDLLVSMHTAEDKCCGKSHITFKVFDLLDCKNKKPSSNQNSACEPILIQVVKDNKNKSIDKSWVRQPVQLVAPRDSENSPLIFFSKIEKLCKDNKPCAEDKTSEDVSNVNEFRYHFAYAKLEKSEKGYQFSKLITRSECTVNLYPANLLDSNDELNLLIKRAKPSVLEKKDGGYIKYEKYKTDYERKYLSKLVNKEFFERWANAQVIPGWFFNQGDNVSINAPLDVAIIFRGYTKYSFLISNVLAQDDKGQEIKPFYTSQLKSGVSISCEQY